MSTSQADFYRQTLPDSYFQNQGQNTIDQMKYKLTTEPYNPANDALYAQYGITPPPPSTDSGYKGYSPDVGGASEEQSRWLQNYEAAIPTAPKTDEFGRTVFGYDPQGNPISDLSRGIQDVGPYTAFKYESPEEYYTTQQYDPTTYDFYNKAEALQPEAYQAAEFDFSKGYTPPEQYQAYGYDFADKYQAPADYQAYDYQMPELTGIDKVQPVADEAWNAAATRETEKIGNKYNTIRENLKQNAIQGQSRPEQVAALMADLDVKQSQEETGAQRDIDIQRQQQAVGIAQQEQTLGAQRGEFSATQQAQVQEQKAQDLAKKYGYSVEEARYRVQQDEAQQSKRAEEIAKQYGLSTEEARYRAGQEQSQQTAQAEEMAKKYGMDMDAAKYMVSQYAAQQDAQTKEKQYGTEFAQGEARYGAGLEMGLDEKAAEEAQKAYESQYGLAQDVASTQMAQKGYEDAAALDRANAILQGGQAAGQQFAQQATYETNLTPDERAGAQTTAANTAAMNQYNTKYNPSAAKTTAANTYKAPTSQSPSYKLPTQTKSNIPTTYGQTIGKSQAVL